MSVMTTVVETAMRLQRDFPDIMAGFDLVSGHSSDVLSTLTRYVGEYLPKDDSDSVSLCPEVLHVCDFYLCS